MNRIDIWLIVILMFAGVVQSSRMAQAFQIAPIGSKFEARFTNEKDATLAKIADLLGVLVKGPVHEEITQLGLGCPGNTINLADDKVCADTNGQFATPYVIYGVRWNDLPPFRLGADQGKCSLFLSKTCNTQQTIRFSTQPNCWYCLFKDAEKKAQTQRITGCERGKGTVAGNLMTRSHFGDLQFLHAMASEEGVASDVTRTKILGWLEFAWKVSSREIKSNEFLRDINIPTIKEHFGCTEWTVSDLYILGQQDLKSGLQSKLHEIAFGSVLHTVQDSFARGHTSRESPSSGEPCTGTEYGRLPRIVEFHNYGAQDGKLHDNQDARIAMVPSDFVENRLPDAVIATSNLYGLFDDRAKWNEAEPYIKCLFELSNESRPSSSGEEFRR